MKSSLFANDLIVYIENLKKYKDYILELKSKLNKVTLYKLNIQNQLYTIHMLYVVFSINEHGQ